MHRLLFAAILAAAPAFTQTVDYSNQPIIAGRWTYQEHPGGSDARFLDASNLARATLSCDKVARRVTISRISAISATALTIWTTDTSRSLAAAFDQTGQRVYASVGVSDALLDGIAFSRGRFVIAISGGGPLVLPAWPEAARVVEDCRF